MSAGRLHAFDSPNLGPLASIGIDIKVDYETVLKPVSLARFRVCPELNRQRQNINRFQL